MTMSGQDGFLLGARTIPLPSSVSAEARAALGRPPVPYQEKPTLDDKQGWRDFIAATNCAWAAMLKEQAAPLGAKHEAVTMSGVTVHIVDPPEIPSGNADRAVMFVHGGGLVLLGGECCAHFGAMEAAALRCRVFSVDYACPPDNPYPAGLNDCVSVYRALLEDYAADRIVIAGVSAGGNLAAAAALKIRDQGLPMPAALGLFTPEADLTQSGDTFETLREIDNVLVSRDALTEMIALYADGHDLADPYLSPLFADFSRGFPPTFLQSGTRDLFLSNTVRMHCALRKANIAAELYVGEAMPHGGFGGAPEDADTRHAFRKFLAEKAGFAQD